MRRFKFGKLVRDKIVEGIKESGNTPVYYELNEEDYLEELKKKVSEEAVEIPVATDRQELLKELADVLEVIDNLAEALGSSREDLETIRTEKNKKAGSFKKRLYVDYVEVEDNSEWISYYLSSPDKYPEIVEKDESRQTKV